MAFCALAVLAAALPLVTAQQQLNILVYSSLLNDPINGQQPYNYSKLYEQYYGNVEVNLHIGQSMLFVEEAANIDDLDMIIGLSNSEALTTNLSNFVAFNLSASVAQQVLNTIDTMNIPDTLHPFDFGTIGITYDIDKIPGVYEMYGKSTNFTLEQLFSPVPGQSAPLVKNFTVENPTTDTSGLAFLMWTIAEYGDLNIELDGATTVIWNGSPCDWRCFWTRAFQEGIAVSQSWSASFAQFSDENSPINLMSSYGSDPAYSACQNESTIKSLVTYLNGIPYAWLQVEDIAILKSAPNQALAENFTNWFIGSTAPNNPQSALWENQWMTPVQQTAYSNPPACVANNTLLPDAVMPFNSYFKNITNLGSQVSSWLDEWADLYDEYSAPQLVIYTYDSFMDGDPAYNYISAYSAYSGISMQSIKVVEVPSAELGEIAANFSSYFPNGPAPDVVMGLSAVDATVAPNIYTPYTFDQVYYLPSQLRSLDYVKSVQPMDWGLTAIVYSSTKFPAMMKFSENFGEFNLESLLTSGVISNLTVENPNYDTSGVAFLMWTISEYGDDNLNITGKHSGKGNWTDWWSRAWASGMSLNQTWDEAWNLFTDSDSAVNLIVSYGTDPADAVCNDEKNTVYAYVSTINDNTYGWAQIETMGIVSNATNFETALSFVNWFFSVANQEHLPESQYMLPVNNQTQLPSCYLKSQAIYPMNVTLLNSQLSQVNISLHLDGWLSQWSTIRASALSSSPSSTSIIGAWSLPILLFEVAAILLLLFKFALSNFFF